MELLIANKTMLDDIINHTLDSVGSSREKIFDISETSRQEYETLQSQLKDVRIKVADVIERHDKTEMHSKFARNRLAEVSRAFNRYSSEEVRAVYEQANEYQVQLAVLQQEEMQLREKRDDIERRLISLNETIEHAEQLAVQMTVVYNFLTSDLQQVGEALKDAREKQAFGLQIIEAQEEERRRLSREIHDGPAQTMANVLLRSELVERVFLEDGMDAALIEIRDLRKMVRASLAEVRRIIYDLRPMALDDLGLVPTLSKYLTTFEERYNIPVRFKHFGREHRLSQQFEVAMFRLIQESVQNAFKHAEPTEIQVKIEIKPNMVIMIVRDDGKGFDTSQQVEGSFGLLGMKERVNMLKGELKIHSKLNAGTTVFIHIPID